MRLTSLDIKGFKSFADKISVHFNQGITGVVGPNGCGKSNVVDAIRWVLGEQRTKALRSDKMDNLIFNGTKKRKAAGRAEVSLTFENTRNLLPTEFSTVTVSRTLYRSGESEYKINNVPCRLKDISGLFMDTGISSDSYAIIELNMISEILNNKDNLRRRLFEQASGISKYKIRKRETLNKLKATQNDLERVEDLLVEIESNLKTLEKQARRAERYNQIKASYKELSIQFTLHNLKGYKEDYKSLQTKEEEEKGKKTQIEALLAQTEAELAKSKKALIDKEQGLNTAQRTLNEHVSNLRSEENKKGLLNEKIKYLREKKDSLTVQLKTDRNDFERIKKEIALLSKDIKVEEQALNKFIDSLEKSKTQVEKVRSQFQKQRNELSILEGGFREIEGQYNQVERETAVKNSQKENLIREIQDNRIQFQSRKGELVELESNLVKAAAEKEDAEKNFKTLLDKEQAIEEETQKRQSQIEKIREQLVLQNRELDSKTNEYNLTKSLVDNLEGFPESIKYLKKNKEWGTPPLLLSDIINCQEAYKVAIENYLDSYLNYYVVPDYTSAQQAISLLNSNKKGKASFFLLKELPDATSQTVAISDAVAALDIVEVKEEYLALAGHLLHQVYLVDETQIEAYTKQYPQFTFLSNNGRIVKNRGLVSGGSVGAFEGKRIGRVQNLKKLEKAIEKLSASIAKLKNDRQAQESKVATLKASSQKNLIQRHRDHVQKLVSRVISFEANIKNYQLFIEDSESKTSGLEGKIAQLEKELLQFSEKLEKLATEKQQQQQQIETFRNSYIEIESQVSEQSQSFNELNIEFHKQQNKLNGLQQNLQYKNNRINELENKLGSNSLILKDTTEDITNIEKDLTGSDDGLKELYAAKDALEKQVTTAENIYFSSKGEIDAIEDKLRQATRSKDQVDTLLSEFKDATNQLQMSLLSIKERMSIEFGININEIINQEPNDELDKTELEEKVNRLKQRIANYGEVNPFALEAFTEMKERFDFITSQKNDLTEAKTSLLETIEEIEITATEKFLEAFGQVRTNFIDVFQRLFNEGDFCDLKLSDLENPLESKVEIIAKPKGKRPLTIDQLSGGEKSLTAIALIFALYLLKPAPFCILDEVDAPLDDANVEKFNQMIRSFSSNSQFIVVTHNKSTMDAVDTIYGVTMAEAGVSMVVPVDLRNIGQFSAN